MAYFPPQGSTVAFQSDPTKLLVHASVSGNLGPTSVAVLQGTNPWVIANNSVAVMSAVPHSVATLQGTNPWIISNSSVQVNNIVTGQSSVYLIPGVGVLGSVAALQGTAPWQVLVPGSVITVSKDSSVLVALTSTNASVITKLINSSVTAYQGVTPWLANGSVVTNNILTGNSSVQVIGGIGVIGSVAVLQGTNPWILGNSSVLLLPGLNVIGSVAVLQGTNPWVTGFSASPSIVGTYAEDTAHTIGDKGLFTLGIRNDLTASFVSANLEYTPVALDSTGRTIYKPFAADHSSVFGTGSVNGAASVILIAAPGAGLRNYITDVFIANTGSVATLITFTAGGGSILGKTIAPAGGGSNIIGLNFPMVPPPNSPFNFDSGTASSVVHGTAYGYKAP